MKETILIGILTFTFFNSFAQQSLDTTLEKSKLITHPKGKNGNQYFIGDERVKRLKPYLFTFPESALEFKKSRKNSAAALIFMGIGIGGLTTIFVSKDKETVKAATYYVNLSALAGLIYFGLKAKQHRNKSIDNYNKRVSSY